MDTDAPETKACGTLQFVTQAASRVVFGRDSLQKLPEELKICSSARAVIVCSKGRGEKLAVRLKQLIGQACVGVVPEAVQHVPLSSVSACQKALKKLKPDCLIALGGGSPIGLVKAVMYFGLQQTEGRAAAADVHSRPKFIAVPTTYAGSEMTNILGYTDNGAKHTLRDECVRPTTVLYDPCLSSTLPLALTASSAFNAMAHSVEALWDASADPTMHMMAERSISVLAQGLSRLSVDGADLKDPLAREELLYGAYLAGTVLTGAKMAVHHKMCHTLGGSFNLPHAEVHTAVLPYSIQFNRSHAPEAVSMIARAFGAPDDDAAGAIFDLQRKLGCTTALRKLGLKYEDLDRVVSIALQRSYGNPRPLDAEGLGLFVHNAYAGRRPDTTTTQVSPPELKAARGAHLNPYLPMATRGAPLSQATSVVLCVHGRFATAERILEQVEEALALAGRGSKRSAAASNSAHAASIASPAAASRWAAKHGVALLAPQAAGCQWYDNSFLKPRSANEPKLSSALSVLGAVYDAAKRQVGAERIMLVGFSQGACLAAELAATLAAKSQGTLGLGALVMFSGGMLGEGDSLKAQRYTGGSLEGTEVFLGCSKQDAHVPLKRCKDTVEVLRGLGAAVTEMYFPGDTHAIFPEEQAVAQAIFDKLLRSAARHSSASALAGSPTLPQSDGDPFRYLQGYGLGTELQSEALPGAVPWTHRQPAKPAYGLYTEQLNGSAFVQPRVTNFKITLYRIHPSVATHGAFTPYKGREVVCETKQGPKTVACLSNDFSGKDGGLTPEPMRFFVTPIPDSKERVDFVDGLNCMMGTGSSHTRSGMAIYQWACNANMENRSFYSSDGDFLLVPELGTMDIQTVTHRRWRAAIAELW